ARALDLVRPHLAVTADRDLALACLAVASAHCMNSGNLTVGKYGRADRGPDQGKLSARSLPAQCRIATEAASAQAGPAPPRRRSRDLCAISWPDSPHERCNSNLRLSVRAHPRSPRSNTAPLTPMPCGMIVAVIMTIAPGARFIVVDLDRCVDDVEMLAQYA